MVKVALFILVGATAGFGTFLACGYGQDDRSVAWHRWHVTVMADQLADLKAMLGEFRNAHGRYPTNDEGLATLDTFAGRFKTPSERDPLGGEFNYLSHQFFWQTHRRRIGEYRQKAGHPPRGAQELFDAVKFVPGFPGLDDMTHEVEIAIGPQDNIFFVSPAGVFSPWMLPYVYENRSGLPAEAFAGSPANDGDERYSAKVDQGIYVSAVGGRELVRDLREAWWEYNAPRFVGAGMVVVALVGALLLIRRMKLRGAALAVMLGSGLLGAGADRLGYATCYIMGPLFSDRPPELLVQQKELLRKYHAAGVINDATYARSLKAIDTGPATQPATQPTTKP